MELSKGARVLGAGFALAALVVFGIGPWLIRRGYAEASHPLVNGVFSGRAVHGVDFYLSAWWGAVGRGALIAAALGLLVYALESRPGLRRRLFARLLGGPRILSSRELLGHAVTVGLAGGLGQALYATGRHLSTHRPAAGFFWDLLWMAPLSSALATAILGLTLIVLARLARTPVGVGPATAVLVFPAVFGLMRSEGIALHGATELILALGLTAVVVRFLGARPAGVERLLRRGPRWAAAGFGAAVVLAGVRAPAAVEWWRSRGLPDPLEGPNVVLVILDTVRADHLGLYGYHRDASPNLDRWAEGATVFERAYSTAPWTLPSHVAMFTGRYGYEVPSGLSTPLDDRVPTLAEALRDRGYETAGFVANLPYTSPASGLDRGFARYQAQRRAVVPFLRTSWLSALLARAAVVAWPSEELPKRGRHVTDEFLAWLDRPRERPFFAFLNYFDAHGPYRPPETYRTRFGSEPRERWIDFLGRWNARGSSHPDPSRWVDRYDGAIAYLDEQLGRVFGAVADRGLDANTLVIVTADHGELWGEWGLLEHSNSLYPPLLHVPLIVRLPGGVGGGLRVPQEVSLRDLPVTVLDLVGGGGQASFPGAPFPFAAGETGEGAGRSPRLAEVRPPLARTAMRTLVEGDVQYIRNGDGTEELYLLPDTIDVAANPGLVPVLGRLRAALDTLAPRR